MEVRIVIFLSFTMVTIFTNTLLIWFMYKAFANLTSKATDTMTEFEQSGATKRWIESMQIASRHAVSVTGAAKQQMTEFEPVIGRAHENYAATLAKVDSKLDEAAQEISTGARRMRDTVAKPAFSIMALAAALSRALNDWEPEDDGG